MSPAFSGTGPGKIAGARKPALLVSTFSVSIGISSSRIWINEFGWGYCGPSFQFSPQPAPARRSPDYGASEPL